jgi:hypothetical protein
VIGNVDFKWFFRPGAYGVPDFHWLKEPHVGEFGERDSAGYKTYRLFGTDSDPGRSGLFMEFAAIGDEPLRVIEFADKHGLLGVGTRSSGYYVERLAVWRYETAAMSMATRALQCFWRGEPMVGAVLPQDGDAESDVWELESLDRASLMTSGQDPYTRHRRGEADARYELWNDRGWGVFQRLVDSRLQEYCGTALTAKERPPYGETAQEQSPLRLSIVPQNLLGAMWLQVAIAAQGDTRFGKCRMCDTWWAVTEESRSDRKWCKTHDRLVGNLRKRAVRLRKSDVSDEAIMNDLGLDSVALAALMEPGRASRRHGA